MHHDEKRILARVDRALAERIAPAAFAPRGDLRVAAWRVPGEGEPVPAAEAARAQYAPAELPVAWGRAWSTWWFRLEGEVPASVGGGAVLLDVDLGFIDDWPGNQCEGLLHGEDLVPLKAINSRNRRHRITAEPGTGVSFLLEAAANPDMLAGRHAPTELGDRLTAPEAPVYELRTARFVERDDEVWALWHDVDVLRGLAEQLPAGGERRAEIVCALDDMVDALDLHDVTATASAARAALAPVLAAPANASALEITAIGHAHIDSAWLWPVRETVRKVARTFSNVDVLMGEYPDFTFTATSAQQYAWLRDTQPEIHERVRARIAEGRWHPSGGMWVEPDANLPGGEALVRQFAYGTRFFEREYGVRSRTLWLPDSFGYSAALPQIARQVGLDFFLTQKISWSKTNRYPHSTFWWEGIDGTRVFTHFPPVDCYDSMLTADEIAHAESGYREKGRAKAQVIPYGYGDGGGGPTATMVERARRRADLEGSARIRMGAPDAFFDEALAEYGDRAPVQRGELYLEFHRGVYTSQLEMKQGNRRAEHALRELELVWSLVQVRGLGRIDQEAVDRLWERALLLQFHDILPGSSIAWVHRDARADYAWILARCEELTAEGLALLAGADAAGAGAAPAGAVSTGADLSAGTADARRLVLNTAGHDRCEVIDVDGAPRLVRAAASGLTPLPIAETAPGARSTAAGSTDPGAESPGDPGVGPDPVRIEHDGEDIVLDNGRVRVRIAPDGTLSSVRDLRADREAIAPGGRGNELQMFEDVPNEFDAWDVDRHYRGSPRRGAVGAPTRCEVTEAHPLRASVTIERLLGDSPATQTVSLSAGARRVDLALDVDWHERETLLKAAFPLAVHAAESVAEIQFGHIARPLHENTSWEFAKFELPGHRWVLAAEPGWGGSGGWGAALVNDSTYGFDAMPWTREHRTEGTLLRLSLMRAPNWPDPRADRSRRCLRWSLLVGADPLAASQAGHELNLPLRVVEPAARGSAPAIDPAAATDPAHPIDPGTATEPAHPTDPSPARSRPEEGAAVAATGLTLARTDAAAAVIDAILPAHDGSGDLIVRLHEAAGSSTRTALRLGIPVRAVREVNPLDEPVAGRSPLVDVGPLDPGAPIPLTLRPFRIVSLRVTPADLEEVHA